MKNVNVKSVLKSLWIESNVMSGDSIFFAGQYPEWMKAKTDLEWVKYMNKKYGFKWTGKDSK